MTRRSAAPEPSRSPAFSQLDELCVNTLRTLAMDMVQKANSGHPGAPMGLAPLAYVLWTRHLRFDPRDPAWPGRDRFVLSAGHACALHYILLHLTGFDVSMEDLRNFRQWESLTPGHPERDHTPGIEITTGPLGQGISSAVGMAIAARFLAARFNRPGHPVIDHQVYVIASDGDLMEGVASEAASIAGFQRLGNLNVYYDDNHITIDGSTDLAFREDVGKRFEAYGWRVLRVEDGNRDLAALDAAIATARDEHSRPTLVIVRTSIGYGSPGKQDTAAAHGSPLGEDEVRLTKQKLGWPESPAFLVPDDALKRFREAVPRGEVARKSWTAMLESYRKAHPDLAAIFEQALRGELPKGWSSDLPRYEASQGAMATRTASGKALNAIAKKVPVFLGGSADLAPSNNTLIDGEESLSADNPGGRNIHFGVREHAMGAVLNGMAAHGGVVPYGGTFLVFADYMRPSIRLAAMQKLHTIYVFTHDSIGLGEDGPTHQPIEHLAMLRATPGLAVIRPGDANETTAAWREVMERSDAPAALILTRQKLPILDGTADLAEKGVARGAYVLADAVDIDAIVIASGSEVQLAMGAREAVAREGVGVRVVSFPCWEWFARQDAAYREAVLPASVTRRLVVEAASPFGWERWAGSAGSILGIDRFGASAPEQVNLEKFGYTVENVTARLRALLSR
ncbi:MAG: transketolase [Deltaproteobacteria bacterium]|nr:transketolase [Deltaproteobacteria bacterium]